jgi:hypothetical protein
MKTLFALMMIMIAAPAFAESGAVIYDSLGSLKKSEAKSRLENSEKLNKKQREDCAECGVYQEEKKKIEDCAECKAVEKKDKTTTNKGK